MKNPTSYLKMRVLGAIQSVLGNTLLERIKNVASMIFVDEEGHNRSFTWKTIITWHYNYKNHGVTGIKPKIRSDKGTTRKTTPEDLLEAINQVKPFFRKGRLNKTAVYRKIIERGIISRNNLAPTTYYRFVREYDLFKDCNSLNKRRLAFAMKYANELWQGDTMFGPNVKNTKGVSVPVKLIAFIDDASRLVCHAAFFFHDNTDSLIKALKSAFYKRGIPQQLYFDNGPNYKAKEISLICARVGCLLRHTPVRDGAAKGKIERWYRTVRDCFLTRNLDLSSIDVLNKQLHAWVEDEYNHKYHSTIGMKPIDRYNLDANRIKFLANLLHNDELFFNEEQRFVLKDNTFHFKTKRYEAPAYLAQRKIDIRYERNNPDSLLIVYYKNERLGPAKLVDFIANGKLRNKGESND